MSSYYFSMPSLKNKNLEIVSRPYWIASVIFSSKYPVHVSLSILYIFMFWRFETKFQFSDIY